MSCWTKEELENMLEDVVNELHLSGEMIAEHGPLGTAPSELVRIILKRKDLEIRLLTDAFTKLKVLDTLAARSADQEEK